MAIEGPLVIKDTKVAGSDLSAKQYYFVKLNSSNQVVPITALTDIPFGVLQNNPTSGKAAEVVLLGQTKVSADSAIAVADFVGPSVDGQCDTKAANTGGTDVMVGRCTVAAANAGEIGTAFINCLVTSIVATA